MRLSLVGSEMGLRDRGYGGVFLCSALVFGLLPWAAGFTVGAEVWYCGLAGGSVFTAAAWLFSSMMERLDSGRSSRFTPLICALGLYLAVQAFSGMG